MQLVVRACLIAAVVVFVSSTPAMAQLINCPVPEAQRSISTPLPSEWRQVPFTQRVTGVRVRESGTLQTLICDYGEAGTIERDGPRNARCTVRGTTAFFCQGPMVAVLPGVQFRASVIAHSGGTATLRYDAPNMTYFDLDTGTATAPPYQSDLGLHVNASNRWEMTRTGIRLWQHNGTTPMGAAGCEAERATRYNEPYSNTLPEPGRYMCYITNGGRVGELQTMSRGTTPGGSPTITITFTTWRGSSD